MVAQMVIDRKYRKAVSAALRSGVSFALLYRKGCDVAEFFAGDTDEDSFSPGVPEFVAVGWLGSFENRVRIPLCTNPEWIQGLESVGKVVLPEMPAGLCQESLEYYIDSLTGLVDELRTTGGKTVISRAIIVGNKALDIVDAADRYFAAAPDSYRCLFYTPATGCWLIASPELLLRIGEGKRFSTMSLAGTRVFVSEEQSLRPWDDKNIHEQALVTSFIADTLRNSGAEVHVGETHTRHAAHVEHICTMIDGCLGTETRLSSLLDNLSPTPALCGTPRGLSIERIRRIERHDREMYGGYFGVDNRDGSLELAVNLRSARLFADGACLFAGGGITADSVPAEEWRETRAKAAVLSEILMS